MRSWWSTTLDRMVPPVADEAGHRRARFLGTILLALAIAGGVILVPNLIRQNGIGIAANLSLLGLVGASTFLLKRVGHERASAFFIGTTVLLLGVPAWFAGGSLGAGFATMMMMLVAGAILLPARGAALIVVYTVCVGLAALFWPPPAELVPPGWLHLGLWTMALTITGSVVFGLTRVTETSLVQASERTERVEAALADLHATTASRDYLQDVLSSLREFIVVTDADGAILTVNKPVHSAGNWSEDQVLNQPLERLFPQVDWQLDTQETPFTRANGSMLPVLLQRSALPDSGNVVWAATDVSFQRATTEALRGAHARAEAANFAKSNFLANMSHELRTPLNAIIGYTELIGEQTDDTDIQPDVERITAASHTLLTLINGVLDLSKIELGRLEIQLADTTAEDVIEPVIAMVRPLAEGRGLSLVVDVPKGIHVYTDRQRLRQVISNLLTNAVKFTPLGRVTLTVHGWERDKLGWVRFTVSDTGIGMTPEQLATAFEPFAQVGAPNQAALGGAGLGLSICKAYVEGLGGQIVAESSSGVGSRFVVEVPAGKLPDLVEAR